MQIADPTFPPLLTGHAVDPPERAFETACARAAAGEAGAGDVLWSRNEARIEIAIVLEPEVGMETAAQMLPLCLVAIGDCLGALTPPQVGVTFTWPNIVCMNGAPAGLFHAAAAPTQGEGDVPDWMVLALDLHHKREEEDAEPGETPNRTWLSEEGGGELTHAEIIESYSRHFLTWLNMWNDDGFKPVHDSWMFRAQNKEEEITLTHRGRAHEGTFIGLDESGNLLLKETNAKVAALYLAACFERPEAGG